MMFKGHTRDIKRDIKGIWMTSRHDDYIIDIVEKECEISLAC